MQSVGHVVQLCWVMCVALLLTCVMLPVQATEAEPLSLKRRREGGSGIPTEIKVR